MAGKALFRFPKLLGDGQKLAMVRYKGKKAQSEPATVGEAKPTGGIVNILITHQKYNIAKFAKNKKSNLFEFRKIVPWTNVDTSGKHNQFTDLVYTHNCGHIKDYKTKEGNVVQAVLLKEKTVACNNVIEARIIGGIPQTAEDGRVGIKLLVVPTNHPDTVFKRCFDIQDVPKAHLDKVQELLAKSQLLKNQHVKCVDCQEASEVLKSLEYAPEEVKPATGPW